MQLFRRATLAAAVALAASLTACSESTSPDTVSPESLNSELDGLVSTFDNNVAFQSLKSLQLFFPAYGSIQALRATLPDAPQVTRFTGARAAQLIAALRAPIAGQALFPADVLGKTLAWNAETDQYVVSDQAGAPANGVRILLYVVDPVFESPVEPLQQIGYVDLTDESTAAVDKLGVLLKLGNTTIADYDITATTTTTGGSLGAAGFVTSADGSQQITFELAAVVTETSVSFTYDISGSDGTAVFLDLEFGAASVTAVFRVSHGGNTVEMNITLDGETFSGSIKFNGTVVANLVTTIEGDLAIEPVEGRTLTQAQVTALLAMFERIGDFLDDFTEGILGPGAIVFGRVGL
jgi:hypothetical protein